MTDPAPGEEPAQPALDDVRAWIGVPETVISDEQLQVVIDAEEAVQAKLCRVVPWVWPLTQALYRRVGREVAAMSLPLGTIGADSETGVANLPTYDAEIQRLERPYRLVVLG
jgi:hypothetical protein